MPSLQVPGAALLRLIWFTGSGTGAMYNVLGLSITGTVTFDQTLANTLDTMVKAAFSSSGLIANVSASNSLFATGIRDIRTANQAEFVGSGAPVLGTAPTADRLPGGVALVVSLKTARSGPSFRGRVYLGGFTETENIATAQASTALVTNAGNFISTVRTNLGASGLGLAVVSRPAERRQVTTEIFHSDGSISSTVKNHPARTGVATPVTAVNVRNATWDSQRRRTAPGSGSTLLGVPLWSEDGGLRGTPA